MKTVTNNSGANIPFLNLHDGEKEKEEKHDLVKTGRIGKW